MEKGTRVQEIKKRFEGLNSQKDDSLPRKNSVCNGFREGPSNSVKDSSDVEYQCLTKGNIKRSHAFRNDKTKVKGSNPVCLQVKRTTQEEIKVGSVFEDSMKFDNKINHNSRTNICKPILTNQNGTDLSDTLKKVLKNPLPPGPAPKKPPRTFAHSGKSLELLNEPSPPKENVVHKLSDSVLLPRNDNVLPSKFIACSMRSKTDPHIMLKKLESALLTNQVNNNSKSILTPCSNILQKSNEISQNTSQLKLNKLCFNGLSSCINTNVYDAPFEPYSRKSSNLNLELQAKFKNISHPLKKVQNSVHIYEELYSPKNGHKYIRSLNDTSQNKDINTSLHYMSSPVNDTERKIFPGSMAPTVLKSTLCLNNQKVKMITDAFNDNVRSDSDADSVKDERVDKGTQEEVTAVRKIYVKRVSSMRQQTIKLPTKGQDLFEALLLIGIDQDLKLGKVPYVKSKYPETAVLPESLAELVFPDAEDWPPNIVSISGHHNNYTLVLTSSEGTRKYAYCRRLQPEGAPICIPLAYVLITSHKDNIFYYNILAELEARHGLPEIDYFQFVRTLYYSSIPKPGLNLQFCDILLKRTADPRQESYDISRVLQALTVPIFIKVFSTLLIEKKVILVGSNISVVSDCIEGLLKALFPFEWEHTLIGAVPSSMLELCTAPTPFLMGVIRPKLSPQPSSFLPLTSIDDCLVADVDSSEVIKSCGDENSILPNRLSSCLKSALYLCPVHGSDIGPSEAFVRLFVEMVGHYNSYVLTDVHTNNRTFQREAFVKAPSSRSLQFFLDWFTETAMFQSFILKRLERSFEPGIFEQRCAEFVEENIKNHNMKKERSLNKTVKSIGGRFKEWTSSS